MIFYLLSACVAPNVLDVTTEVTINPGETEPWLLLEGPGVIFADSCTSPDITLWDEAASNVVPRLLASDVISDIWIRVDPSATAGTSWCFVVVPGENFVVEVNTVVL